MRRRLVAAALVGLLLAGGALYGLNHLDEGSAPKPPEPATPALLARGEYLARAGNCMGCHTQRGGAPYAGGRPIPTPFGNVFAPNLTPDAATGLGA